MTSPFLAEITHFEVLLRLADEEGVQAAGAEGESPPDELREWAGLTDRL